MPQCGEGAFVRVLSQSPCTVVTTVYSTSCGGHCQVTNQTVFISREKRCGLGSSGSHQRSLGHRKRRAEVLVNGCLEYGTYSANVHPLHRANSTLHQAHRARTYSHIDSAHIPGKRSKTPPFGDCCVLPWNNSLV